MKLVIRDREVLEALKLHHNDLAGRFNYVSGKLDHLINEIRLICAKLKFMRDQQGCDRGIIPGAIALRARVRKNVPPAGAPEKARPRKRPVRRRRSN